MEANRTQLMELILVIDAKVTSTELNLDGQEVGYFLYLITSKSST